MDRRTFAALLACLGIASAGAAAQAVEVAGVQVELHGSYELQLRGIVRDFDFSDDLDLTQWYNVLNLETEFDFAPDGWGPFDVLQAFMRVEVRYDCVWTRGCGIFSSADAFGDRAQEAARAPLRRPARRLPGGGHALHRRHALLRATSRASKLPFEFRDLPRGLAEAFRVLRHRAHRHPVRLAGRERHLRRRRRPGALLLRPAPRRVRLRVPRHGRAGERGGHPEPGLEPGLQDPPDRPTLSDKPNPLRAGDLNPLTGSGGVGALPLRPAPERRVGSGGPDLAGPGRLLPEPAPGRAAARRRVRRLRPELPPGRSWPGTAARASRTRRS